MFRDDPQKHKRFEQFVQSVTNHTPDGEKIIGISTIRNDAKNVAYAIIDNTPPGREQSLALTALEESVMWAVKAVVLPRA